jgi:MFS family permease
MVATYLYLWLLVSGVASNLMNTVTYDSFPTHLRSMAISTTMLFGRLGGLAGGNVASYLLEDNCNWTFSVGGLLLVVCGCMVFFLPVVIKRNAKIVQ